MSGHPVDGTTRRKRRLWLGLTLAALIVSLAALVTVTLDFVDEADATLRLVGAQAALSGRLRELDDVQSALADAESAGRGYLLTDDARTLAPYRAAIARLPAAMRAFEAAPTAERLFDRQAEAARRLVDDHLADLAEAVRLQARGLHADAVAHLLGDRGVDGARLARADIARVRERVGVERDRIVAEIAERITRIQRLLLLAVSSLVVFLVLTFGQTMQMLATRTRFAQALGRSEQRHRALVEDQNELVSLAREDGTLVYVNPAFARHVGRAPAELVGTDRYDLMDASEREATRLEVAGVLRTGRERHGEHRRVMADGSERWVAWTDKRRQEPDGALLHSVGRDVTERKLAERALRASQSFLHRTSRIAGVGGWELDLRTNEPFWSAEVKRILEVDDDHVPNRDDAVASYAPEAREALDKAVADCLERGMPWDLELPRFTATGRRIWVRTVGSLEFEAGQPRRVVGALQDITERKQLEQRLADGERFVRQITDSLPVRIAYFDTRARYRFVNLAHCRRFGKPREQILGRTRSEMTGGQSDAVYEPHIAAVLRGEPSEFEYEETLAGYTRRIAAHLLPDVDADGEVRGFYATGIDITDRVAARNALLRQTATLQSVTEALPAMVAVIGRDERYRFVNSAYERWAGRPRDRLLGRPLGEAIDPVEYALRRPWAQRALAGETVSFETHDPARRVQHLGLTYIPLRNADEIDGYVAVAQDITLQKEETGRLLQLTQHDALTGLLNRAGFEAWLARRTQDDGLAGVALLYVDLDRFKPVNDTHGHPAGDAVLRGFGDRLQVLVRPSDAVARLGGDEFAVALGGVREHAHAEAVAAKIVAAGARAFVVDGRELQVGASVGLAFQPADANDWHDLIAHADARLYDAKAAGRGRYA